MTVYPQALSSEPDSIRFAIAASAYMGRLDRAPSRAIDETQGYEVTVTTLDATIDALGREDVSLLKLNVSGFEPQVLAGGRAVLRAGRIW